MKLAGVQVLVTGAGGFIGSHLAEQLVREGARVRAFVRYKSDGSWGWLDHSPHKADLEVVAGDVADAGSVGRAVAGCEAVFHLAALIGIPYSYQAPLSYLRTNVEGTLNILQAAREAGVQRVVHTSTSEVYGSAQYVPIDEAHPLVGQSPYSATKIGADKLAESYHRSFGLPVVTIRPFNTFGPRQSARAVIPTIISQALAGRPIRLGSLTPTRDMNYVANTVAAYVCAAQNDAAIGQVVNAGSGREISIGDLARLIGALAGIEPQIESDDQRLRPPGSEVDRLLADNSRARQLLDWKPRVTLEEGLRETIDWMRANLHRYRLEAYAV
jgi:NAD dependent epimerase/dehydratase